MSIYLHIHIFRIVFQSCEVVKFVSHASWDFLKRYSR